MSWAANSPHAIDATPLAATVRASASAAGSGRRFGFLSEPSQALAQPTAAERGQAAFRAASAAAKRASNSSLQHSNSQDRTAATVTPKPSASSLSAPAGDGAQEALRAELAHWQRECARAEQKLADKDAALEQAQAAMHRLEGEKSAEAAKQRATIQALRKSVAEWEARVQHLTFDMEDRKEKEISQIQRHNALLLEQQNELLQAVSNTIKQSADGHATAAPQPIRYAGEDALTGGVNVGFGGAGSGLSHEEHLKSVMEGFREERSKWDRSRAKEIESLKAEHRAEVESLKRAHAQLKSQYSSQYASWQQSHASFTSEVDLLTEYLVKLTYLFEEIDRGRFPVAMKHGVTTWNVPRHKRAFLARPKKSSTADGEGGCSALLEQKLAQLAKAFQRAGIPYDPFQLEHEQSFLTDDKQRQWREEQQNRRQQQQLAQGDSEDRKLLAEEKEQAPFALMPASSDSSSPSTTAAPFDQDSLLSELQSDSTVAYIAHLESERDAYRQRLSQEVRRRAEQQTTWASRTRIVEQKERSSRQAKEQARARRSSEGNAASISHLLHSALPKPSAHFHPPQPVAHETEKLHSVSSMGACKSRDIVAASSTVALHPAAGKLGVQVGWSVHRGAAGPQSQDGGVGLSTADGLASLSASGSVGLLASPSRALCVEDTPHTDTGSYVNANLPPQPPQKQQQRPSHRPASASVTRVAHPPHGGAHPTHGSFDGFVTGGARRGGRPFSAVSAATTSYLGAGSSTPSVLGTPSRPASASTALTYRSMASSPAPPPHVAAVPGSSMSFAAPPAHFPKPTPLHFTHGNVSAALYATQLAKKAHAESRPGYSASASGASTRRAPAASPRPLASTSRSARKPATAMATNSAR